MDHPWVPPIVIVAIFLIAVIGALIVWLVQEFISIADDSRQRKVAEIEAELDEKSEQMRAAIYEIASALHQDGHRARKDMIREAFLYSETRPEE